MKKTYQTDQERWEDPDGRKLIEDAIESVDTDEVMSFMLEAAKGTPWYHLVLERAAVLRVRNFFEHAPRFV